MKDFEAEAGKVLPKAVFDYYRSGADDQSTLADNTAAFNRYTHDARLSPCDITSRHHVKKGGFSCSHCCEDSGP